MAGRQRFYSDPSRPPLRKTGNRHETTSTGQNTALCGPDRSGRSLRAWQARRADAARVGAPAERNRDPRPSVAGPLARVYRAGDCRFSRPRVQRTSSTGDVQRASTFMATEPNTRIPARRGHARDPMITRSNFPRSKGGDFVGRMTDLAGECGLDVTGVQRGAHRLQHDAGLVVVSGVHKVRVRECRSAMRHRKHGLEDRERTAGVGPSLVCAHAVEPASRVFALGCSVGMAVRSPTGKGAPCPRST
jgi:hypothetical protein